MAGERLGTVPLTLKTVNSVFFSVPVSRI